MEGERFRPRASDLVPTSFAAQQGWQTHEQRQMLDKPHKVEEPYLCGRSFAWPASFEQDTKQLVDEKPYSYVGTFPQAISTSSMGAHQDPVPETKSVLDTSREPLSAESNSMKSASSGDAWPASSEQHLEEEEGERPSLCEESVSPNNSFDSEKQAGVLDPHVLAAADTVNSTGGCMDKGVGGDSQQFSCKVCGASFAKQYCLQQHILKLHGGDEKRFVCSECNASFFTITELTAHMPKHEGRKPYMCFECNATFISAVGLRQHALRHSGQKKYKCEICDTDFMFSSQLKVHVRRHNGVKPYACDQCQASFVDRSSFKKHLRVHSGEKPFSCSVCAASFSRSTHLRRHMIKHSDDRPCRCSKCALSFKCLDSLRAHMKTHSKVKSCPDTMCEQAFSQSVYKCDTRLSSKKKRKALSLKKQGHHTGRPKQYICVQCGASFLKASKWKKHLHGHTRQKSFSCPQCRGSFFTASALKRHRLWQLGKRPFKCAWCKASFRRAPTLRKHSSVHTQTEGKVHRLRNRYVARTQTEESMYSLKMHSSIHIKTEDKIMSKCELCGAEFREPAHLRIHVISHGFQQPHVRDLRRAASINSSSSKKLEPTHVNKKSFMCPVCASTFSRSCHLKRHMLKHPEDEHFKCNQCSDTFKSFGTLKSHLKTHTDTVTDKKRPYTCKLCGSSFRKNHGLKEHMRTHTGERPLKCDMCPATFVYARCLAKHRQIHLKDGSLSCDVCGRAFSRATGLEKHKLSHGPIIESAKKSV